MTSHFHGRKAAAARRRSNAAWAAWMAPFHRPIHLSGAVCDGYRWDLGLVALTGSIEAAEAALDALVRWVHETRPRSSYGSTFGTAEWSIAGEAHRRGLVGGEPDDYCRWHGWTPMAWGIAGAVTSIYPRLFGYAESVPHTWPELLCRPGSGWRADWPAFIRALPAPEVQESGRSRLLIRRAPCGCRAGLLDYDRRDRAQDVTTLPAGLSVHATRCVDRPSWGASWEAPAVTGEVAALFHA